jgi:LEA14-like dessication related protein
MRRCTLAWVWAVPLLGACGSLSFDDPPRVALVGLQGLPGEGLEWRFMARLRVQNPNSRPLAYDGVSLDLGLRGQPFANGVAPLTGELPPYGEAVLEVPVSASGLTLARQLLDLLRGTPGGSDRVSYTLRGRLGGALGGTRFETSGEIDLEGLAR